MPLYEIDCECGSTEGFSTFSDREANDGKVPCLGCEVLQRTYISPANLNNMTWPGGKEFKQIGKTFDNAKEMEQWAEKNNLEPVSNDSARWRNLKLDSKQANDNEAVDQGFRNADDRRHEVNTKTEELLDRNIAAAATRAVAAENQTAPTVKHLTPEP